MEICPPRVTVRWVLIGNIPLMTSRGHFLINGVPRVVVHQLVRRPGVYYHHRVHKINQQGAQTQVYRTYYVDIIVQRGSWLRFEVDKKQQLWACARRVTRTPISYFFKALGISRKRMRDDWSWSINYNFKESQTSHSTEYLKNKFLQGALDQGGREQINLRLGVLETQYYFTPGDFLQIVRSLIEFARRGSPSIEVDHLNQKCVRAVGELLIEPVQRGVQRFGQIISNQKGRPKHKLMYPTARPITGSLREFFLTHPLSQFMDETNPLSELTHKRRLSALGPGGVRRDSAGMSVRGIHPTYYGRLCPIETPEGQNAGLVNSLATWACISGSGVLLAPFQPIFKGQAQSQILPRFLTANLEENSFVIMADNPCSSLGFFKSHSLIARHGQSIQKVSSNQLEWMSFTPLSILSVATSLIPFLEHDDANRALMGSNMQRQAVPLIINQRACVQTQLEPRVIGSSQAGFQSCWPGLILYVSKTDLEAYVGLPNSRPLLPPNRFLINRTKNRQGEFYPKLYQRGRVLLHNLGGKKRAKSLSGTAAPTTWFRRTSILSNLTNASKSTKYFFQKSLGSKTGLGYLDFPSFESFQALRPSVTNAEINEAFNLSASRGDSRGAHRTLCHMEFQHFERSNQGTLVNQKPTGRVFDWIQGGDLVADAATSSQGALSLGREIWVAYMPWEGYNFEDAVLINRRLVSEETFTSLHIERLTIHIRETQHGLERLTSDFPGASGLDRARLDFNGIIQLGAWVQEGDVLVGKITPIQPRTLHPHERLLYDIVGQSTECVKDSSLRVPKGIQGRVIRLTISRQVIQGNGLGFECVQVYVAQKRTIKVGDKVAGRHGNKGVISKILPPQDLPYLLSGQVVDMVLNPLGVPSRMNVGQLFECMLGLAGHMLNEQFTLVPFDEGCGFEASRSFVYSKLLQLRQQTRQRAWFSERSPGKVVVFDGRTGQRCIQTVTVGCAYILKLVHLVDEKIHARSTGPYSLITQQPLRGRSKHGGQRLGEMEVWALEGFGCAYTLQELLTVKSDDARGRNQVMEALLKNTPMRRGTPESFKVLLRELQALCLDIKICRRIF
uniref:DNA-directed RNA polymerase subunit beta n=1 Tax=Pseudobryopsis hainanensis TaxID=2320808 RepID=A0A3S5X2Q5_9CHLO|nr:RNA polymerase b-subunit [Pseudobryopsis hainanensis]